VNFKSRYTLPELIAASTELGGWLGGMHIDDVKNSENWPIPATCVLRTVYDPPSSERVWPPRHMWSMWPASMRHISEPTPWFVPQSGETMSVDRAWGRPLIVRDERNGNEFTFYRYYGEPYEVRTAAYEVFEPYSMSSMYCAYALILGVQLQSFDDLCPCEEEQSLK